MARSTLWWKKWRGLLFPFPSSLVLTKFPSMPRFLDKALALSLQALSTYWLLVGSRDMLNTGNALFGGWDSHEQDWMSSAVYSSTDFNSKSDFKAPGCLFIRKLGGAAMVGHAISKVVVSLVPSQPTVIMCLLSNIALIAFYVGTTPVASLELFSAHITALVLESIVLTGMVSPKYLGSIISSFRHSPLASPTVARTVCVTAAITLPVHLRDLFFPGIRFPVHFPGDVGYLTFTRSYLHSPPDHDDPSQFLLHSGDSWCQRQTAILLVLATVHKLFGAICVRDKVSARTCWKIGTVGNILIYIVLYRFVWLAEDFESNYGEPWPMRHVLMVAMWETFVLGVMGFL